MIGVAVMRRQQLHLGVAGLYLGVQAVVSTEVREQERLIVDAPGIVQEFAAMAKCCSHSKSPSKIADTYLTDGSGMVPVL